ncbi:protein sorting-associated protein 13 [Seminavis robusta]|uniref:Protein sorting-associated protein 13 n=1 Tax=Seminavis robusta TaxID=568900 RepID=A0A9N8DVV7_9STRA|nr:protein sorting-associated protein 13 [Seminavis robusta]|eukprot:Sro411_g137730.1 protein sorting-associated protein 13 (3570) ;mRNA; r:49198-60575
MAKQVIIQAMEEVVGEYVLNMSHDNLKIAAIRGKIKLENVQLDGDLIGSHILGAVGLSGFGILSCWARTVKIIVPWKNLEKEPTRFQVEGVHLVCVPLMPSTATKMYGAGSQLDPRCTLRTRAKRSVLARLERNYFSGRIPGEGPPSKRIRRAVKEVERELRKSKSKKKGGSSKELEEDDDFIIDSLVTDLNEMDSTYQGSEMTDDEEKNSKDHFSSTSERLPELPRDWKVKLREKVLRNMEANMTDVHIRCEVSERGLDFCHPDHRRNTPKKAPVETNLPADQRSFSFGFTLDSLVLRTANEQWDMGSHEKFSSKNQKGSKRFSKQQPDHLGPNEYVARNNKIASLINLKMYWDDEPPILLSETDVLTGNVQKLSAEKLQARISAAMDALANQQEPGQAIRTSLNAPIPQSLEPKRHQYICESVSAQVRIKTSDRTLPGPISCSAEFLPFHLALRVRPHQYIQYQTLKKAMVSQQRFDTMLRQRPKVSIHNNPRAWWAYAISCVMSRPNWRPWQDVLQIVRNRDRYIELVCKKLSTEGAGFHGGLHEKESLELLALEDLLPIEALMAFHLLALRSFYELQKSTDIIPKEVSSGTPKSAKSKSKGFGRFSFFGSSKWKRKMQNSYYGSFSDDDYMTQPLAEESSTLTTSLSGFESQTLDTGKSMSLLEAMTLRLGNKTWYIAFKLADAAATLTLLRATGDTPIVQLSLRTSGIARSFGRAKDFFFDVTKCEVVDKLSSERSKHGRMGKQVLIVRPIEDEVFSDLESTDARLGEDAQISAVPSSTFRDASMVGPDLLEVENFKDLPPAGVVCRVAASKDIGSVKLSIAAHPATLVWTTPCVDAVAEFFAAPSMEKTDITSNLRNAATPLARKAQLALLSPATLALNVNIAAPKVWLPITSKGLAGALFLDAGHFKLNATKGEGQTNMNWDLNAEHLHCAFLRGRNLSQLQETTQFPHASLEANPSTSIVRPFHVNCVARDQEVPDEGIPEFNRYGGSGGTLVRTIEIKISPISLNLVDAEGLARSLGKWYAQGLRRVSSRRRGNKKHGRKRGKPSCVDTEKGSLAASFEKGTSIPQNLSISVEKIEIALEGHSKQASCNFSDDKSLASLESLSMMDISPAIRVYVVEVFGISVRRSRVHDSSTTKFLMRDASIVQLRDASSYVPMKATKHEADESQYCILQGLNTPGELPSAWKTRFPFGSLGRETSGSASDENTKRRDIVSASMFHDGNLHLDEVEIDIDSVVVRVTPTTLKDFLKGLRRIIELVQLMTKEMERKVHEEGRKARRRDRPPVCTLVDSESMSIHHDLSDRPPSPTNSDVLTEASSLVGQDDAPASDSSILFKVTIRESTLLVGRPTLPAKTYTDRKPRRKKHMLQATSFAVIQVSSNALIMFQSVENPDGTGSKTLHASLDNLSASVNTAFERIPPTQAPPMIGPTGAEFRVVYATENLGCVVSQEISLDCESLKSCLTPNDMMILISISRKMLERLRSFDFQGQPNSVPGRTPKPKRSALSLIRYQKRGTGIATRIRVEIHSFSFVLLRAYRSKYGATDLLDFNIRRLKGKLEGCMSALSGDCSASLAVNFYNSQVGDWEYALEPVSVGLSVDQMPNEVVLNLSPAGAIHMNLTGILLRDFADMDFDVLRSRKDDERSVDTAEKALTPSVLSTVGLRRATESHDVRIENKTGLDLFINPPKTVERQQMQSSTVRFDVPEPGFVPDGGTILLDSVMSVESPRKKRRPVKKPTKLSLRLAPASSALIGKREPIVDLSIETQSASLFALRPASTPETTRSMGSRTSSKGRSSPETVQSDLTRNDFISDFAYYNAEPVIEWCFQLQRLRSSTADVFSLQKGRDLLSSSVWSPEDEMNDIINFTHYLSAEAPVDQKESEANDDFLLRVSNPELERKTATSRAPYNSNWLRPYLKNDSPEWTDMTCILRMARERVMLPDSNWIWVNDWNADLSGKFGESTDADGWEYEQDFETFTRNRRFYVRGDCCRRRRWTRTRMVKPPRLDDPQRVLKIVWETSRDETGNYSIRVRSPLSFHNCTSMPLTFFVYSPSWDEDKKVGTADAGESVFVPVTLASAVYLRLARKLGTKETTSISDFAKSERVMILPTSPTSTTYVRTTMNLQDVTNTTLHFLLHVKSNKGIVDVTIEPVMKVINLLPCQLECQLGEVLRGASERVGDTRPVIGSSGKRLGKAETLSVASGQEGKCTAVDPMSKPHISLRVPGYRWSPWQRIVNRNPKSHTWRPSEDEEDWHINSNKSDADYAEEFKSMVRFERTGKVGDPLILIISVECGHSPTVRVYSQYWILDKTGFGCRFCEGFTDLLGSVPDNETSRRSHLLSEEARDPDIQSDMQVQGHQWSIGMSGMSLYFSQREKFALSIESGAGDGRYNKGKQSIRSKWVSPMDVSNVIPKTVFSVEELGGPRQFELAISVTVCPGLFARTKLITLLPRYQIVNLLHRELVVAQAGCLGMETLIPSQSSVPFHWEKKTGSSKVHLGAPSAEERDTRTYHRCWTNGCIQVDRIGITSMRLPTDNSLSSKPMVVQAEVRLATKEQSSAVVVVIWSANEKSNPLYILRNRTADTIICRQPLQDEPSELEGGNDILAIEPCSQGSGTELEGSSSRKGRVFECASEVGPMIRSFLGLDRIEEFVWILGGGSVSCFGFDDPEKPHILEWTCVSSGSPRFEEKAKKAFLEVDAMGSLSTLSIGNKEICCQIGAEHSTKVIEFFELSPRMSGLPPNVLRKQGIATRAKAGVVGGFMDTFDEEDDEEVSFSLKVEVPAATVSIIDNADPERHGREILLAQMDQILFTFSQSREGYHEFECLLSSFQVDNHVNKSIHPVLIFCPRSNESEPFLHMSAVRRLQQHSTTLVFRYAAIRILEIHAFLDRRTAEKIAEFIEPLKIMEHAHEENDEPPDWVSNLTTTMGKKFAKPDRRAPRGIERTIHTANSGRIYFEQLHLHPVRLALTFTQEWMEWNPGSESMMIFQFIRGMASIADAPITFTSFVVSHVFEAPQALTRVIGTHYSSQLTKQVFGIVGSLAILGAPADFISNVGSGVRDFFYEPIQGAVHGPKQFIEGLEAGTQSLARGVFVGVVRGSANVAEVVNGNLAALTADDDFIDERKAHQRMLTDAMSRGVAKRTFGDSLYLAGASVVRGLKSGAMGIVEQPTIYASKHGPVGFVKGVGKAVVGALVKPIVGIGDAAVLVMNHVSDATSNKEVLPKIPKRLRRALPSHSVEKKNCVRLLPYDERAAKAQKIVTGGESVDDVYIGHVNIPSHLIIASEQCLWAIDRRTREPWCVSWEEISHFGISEGNMRVVVFSQTGLKTYIFQMEGAEELHKLLSMQQRKMGNSSSDLADLNISLLNHQHESLSRHQIPGIKKRQVNHVFGSCNKTRKRLSSTIKDEIDLIEQCFARVRAIGSESSSFLKTLDEEAWALVSSWGQVFSGLSSRRCIAASIINGTGNSIQVKSTKLVEGGSPCYSIPTKEFDPEQGVLKAGGAIIFFGWGVVPNLLQAGNVFMHIETNAFISDLSDQKSHATFAEAMPGHQVGFLEKSYDDSGWWAKYWLLVRKK